MALGAGRLSWKLLEPFGAEVDFDMREPLTEVEQKALANLLYTQGWLRLRNQKLDREQQRRFNGYFGPVLSEADEANPYVAVEPEKGAFGDLELAWHRDLPYAEHPFYALSLHALEIDGESWTGFASAARAYQNLPDDMKRRLEGMVLTTALPVRSIGRIKPEDVAAPDWPKVHRPLIIPHPITGVPVIMCCPQTAVQIDGMPYEESEALILDLLRRVTSEGNYARHYWQTGDMVIWDNVGCLHGRGPLKNVKKRTLQRVTTGRQSFFQAWPGVDLQKMMQYALGDAATRTKARASI